MTASDDDRPTVREAVPSAAPSSARGPSELAEGTLVGEQYRILRPLGKGGMAEVMLARDLTLDRDVALKFLAPQLLTSPAWRARFIAEARTMARVTHPNVVQVYAYDVHAGWPYFVMEYVPGESLRDRLRREPFPSVAEALAILEQIAEGLTAIHEAGIVHHDVKPANVLLGPNGRVFVADLGLSRLIAAAAETPMRAGTPRYMAPEQLDTHPQPPDLSPRTDVYQLGVVAYELLTQSPPFSGDDDQKIIAKHCIARPLRPSQVRPELGPLFDAPILMALEKNPNDRMPSPRVLVQRLKQAYSAEPRSLRILVADDEPDLLKVTTMVLQTALPRSTIVTANDGASALDEATRSSFDVVLLDLQMPGMSGLEVAAALRSTTENPAWKSGPPGVVVMTAVGGAAEWRVLRDIGVEAMLLKPLDADLLIATVERAAALRAGQDGPSSLARYSTPPSSVNKSA
jgi:serine/threonine protein kinase